VSTGGLGVHIESIGLREVREVEAPKFPNQILHVLLSLEFHHPVSEAGVQNWALVEEVDKGAHRAVVPPQVPQPV
jgi:hypothetical protein